MVAAKKKTNQHRPKTVSFRLPEEPMEPLRSLAKKNRRTLSGEVQIAIEAHLRANGQPLLPDRDGQDGQA